MGQKMTDSNKLHQIIDNYISNQDPQSSLINRAINKNYKVLDPSHAQKMYSEAFKPENKKLKDSLIDSAFYSNQHTADHANHFLQQWTENKDNIQDSFKSVPDNVYSTKGIDENLAFNALKQNPHKIKDSYLNSSLPKIKSISENFINDPEIISKIDENDDNSKWHINRFVQNSLSLNQHSAEDLENNYDWISDQHPENSIKFFADQENTPSHILTKEIEKYKDIAGSSDLEQAFSHKNISESYTAKTLRDSDESNYVKNTALKSAKIPNEIFENYVRNPNHKILNQLSLNNNLTKDQEAKLFSLGYENNLDTGNSKLSDQEKGDILSSLPENAVNNIINKHLNSSSTNIPDYIAKHLYNTGSPEVMATVAARTKNKEILNNLLNSDDETVSKKAFLNTQLPKPLIADHIKTGKSDWKEIGSILNRNDDKEIYQSAADLMLSAKASIPKDQTDKNYYQGCLSGLIQHEEIPENTKLALSKKYKQHESDSDKDIFNNFKSHSSAIATNHLKENFNNKDATELDQFHSAKYDPKEVELIASKAIEDIKNGDKDSNWKALRLGMVLAHSDLPADLFSHLHKQVDEKIKDSNIKDKVKYGLSYAERNHLGYLNSLPDSLAENKINETIDAIEKHGNHAPATANSLYRVDGLNSNHAARLRKLDDSWVKKAHEDSYPFQVDEKDLQKIINHPSSQSFHFINNLNSMGLIKNNKAAPNLIQESVHALNSAASDDTKLDDDKLILMQKLSSIPGISDSPDFQNSIINIAKNFSENPNNFAYGAKNIMQNIAESEMPIDQKKNFIENVSSQFGDKHHGLLNVFLKYVGSSKGNKDLLNSIAADAPAGHPLIEHLSLNNILSQELKDIHADYSPSIAKRAFEQSHSSSTDNFEDLKPKLNKLIEMHKNGADVELSSILKERSVFDRVVNPEDRHEIISKLIDSEKTAPKAATLIKNLLKRKNNFKNDSGEYDPEIHNDVIAKSIDTFIKKHPSKLSQALSLATHFPSQYKSQALSNLSEKALDAGKYGVAAAIAKQTDDGYSSNETQLKFTKDLSKILSSKKKINKSDIADFMQTMSNDDHWLSAAKQLSDSKKINFQDMAQILINKPSGFNPKSFDWSLSTATDLLNHFKSLPFDFDTSVDHLNLKEYAFNKILSSNLAANLNVNQLNNAREIFRQIDDSIDPVENINASLAVKLIHDIDNVNQLRSVMNSGYTKMTKEGFGGLTEKFMSMSKPENCNWNTLKPMLMQNSAKMGEEYSNKLGKFISDQANSSDMLQIIIESKSLGQHKIADYAIHHYINNDLAWQKLDSDSNKHSNHDKSYHLLDFLTETKGQPQSDLNIKSTNILASHIAKMYEDFNEDARITSVFDYYRNHTHSRIPENASKIIWDKLKQTKADNTQRLDRHKLEFSEASIIPYEDHRSLSADPSMWGILSHQKVHPDNFMDVKALNGLELNSNLLEIVGNQFKVSLSNMDDKDLPQISDKYINFIKSLDDHNVNFSHKIMSRHLTDNGIERLGEKHYGNIVKNGGGTPEWQIKQLQEGKLDIDYISNIKPSQEFDDYLSQNWGSLDSPSISELLKKDKMPSEAIKNIVHNSPKLAKNLDKWLIQSSKIDKDSFYKIQTMTADYYPPTNNSVFEIGKEWSPVFNNATHGYELFKNLKTEIPKTYPHIKNAAIDGVSISPDNEIYQQVLQLTPSEGINWANFKKVAGNLSNNKKIQDLFMGSPKQFLTPEQIMKSMAEKSHDYKVTYTTWDGAQRHSDNSNLVVQVNAGKNLIQALQKDADLKSVYDYINKSANNSSHPVTPYIVGWARVDANNKDNWIIEETQSDFSAGLRKEIDNLKSKGISQVDMGDKVLPLEEFSKHAKTIQTLTSSWLDAAHQAVYDTAKKANVKNVLLHGPDVRASMSFNDRVTEKYPVWLNDMYISYPEENNWEQTDYRQYPQPSESMIKNIKKRPFGFNSLKCWKKKVT